MRATIIFQNCRTHGLPHGGEPKSSIGVEEKGTRDVKVIEERNIEVKMQLLGGLLAKKNNCAAICYM